ncbi:putative ABC-type sugar transport system, permease component [Arthrobacter sp. PAMC 25486]|uniref:carbohydrate ABC transporter permease n=1 Tax=Arthrobacter sp. PAMC 25486 TaxID=1494608 RepID=UPI000535E3A5|nr:sugar ABC transporter permease [Arthrobacter sp. PAMC 25486]AIY00936.1 putative ABC-type sugar transport system, permease component [Arthrobacter sp. PAMC 25486]
MASDSQRTVARRPATAGVPPEPPAFVQRKKKFSSRTGWTMLAFMAPAAIFVAIFTYYPMISGSQMAFRNWNLNDLSDTSWIGLGNFQMLFENPEFGTIVRNTVVWVVGSLVPQVVIGFALALFLKRKFKFRSGYQAFIFFPWAVSGFLIGMLFRWMFNAEFGVVNDLLMKTGLIDGPIPWLAEPGFAMTAIIIANIWYGVTFFAIMILAALQSVNDDMYEAAALDGAGKVRTFFNITLPAISVTLGLTILLRVIWIFNFPDIIWAMTGGGPADQTHIITTYMISITQEGDYGQASALGLIVVFTLMLFAVFYLMAMRPRKAQR